MLNNWKKLWDLEVQINTDPSQLIKRLSIHWVSPFSVKNCGKSKKCAFKLLSHKSLYGTAGKGKSSNYCAYVIESASTLTHALFFFSCRFCILYIHCFVYTVYDDFSGQWAYPGHSGQNANFSDTANTTTETNSTGMCYCIDFDLKVGM